VGRTATDAMADIVVGYTDRIAELEAALRPFAVYADARLRMPLNSLGDSVHTIHGGTEYEAEIKFSHCLAALEVLHKEKAI